MINKLERKNFIWNFLGLTTNAFNSFFFLIIVNRINGIDDAGVFTYAYSLICLFYFIGLYFSRAFQISNRNYSNKDYLVNRSISCILMMLVTIIAVVFFKYSLFKSMVIILIALFRLLEAFADVFYGMEQLDGKLYKAGFSMFLKSVIGLSIFIIIDLVTKNLLLSILSLSLVSLLFILIYDIPNSKKYISSKLNYKNVAKIFKVALPIFIFSFLNLYLVNVSKYALDFYDTSKIQNIYGIILMPGTVLSLVSQYILYPYMVKLTDSHNKKQYVDFDKIINKITMCLLILGILAVIVFYLIGIPLLNIIYNLKLENYKLEAIIIVIGSVFCALVTVMSAVLTILNKNVFQMNMYLINSILSTILCLCIIKPMGILGSSIVYISSMFIQYIAFLILYKLIIVRHKEVKR